MPHTTHDTSRASLLDRAPRALDAVIQERWLKSKISDLEAERLLVTLCRHTPWLAGNKLRAWTDARAAMVVKAPLNYREADFERAEPDGLARKCFTCAGWTAGVATCSICRFKAISYFVCDHWQRHARYGAAP